MCVAKGWFERHWQGAVKGALLAFGPLMVVCNLAAQQVPFNAIFLISDPMQKWRCRPTRAHFLPFLAGALNLGVSSEGTENFNRVYFADLVGSGLCGLAVLLASTPHARRHHSWRRCCSGWRRRAVVCLVRRRARRDGDLRSAVLAALVHLRGAAGVGSPSSRVGLQGRRLRTQVPGQTSGSYERASPFGYMEVYPPRTCTSRQASRQTLRSTSRTCRPTPISACISIRKGPSGIIKDLRRKRRPTSAICRCFYPYVLSRRPRRSWLQFGGGCRRRSR